MADASTIAGSGLVALAVAAALDAATCLARSQQILGINTP